MADPYHMSELLEYIVKNIVTKPDRVKISEERLNGEVNFNLSVDPADMGVIIGKGGKTIKALRKLLVARSLAENARLRVNLLLIEPT